jgi:hypothetical protein
MTPLPTTLLQSPLLLLIGKVLSLLCYILLLPPLDLFSLQQLLSYPIRSKLPLPNLQDQVNPLQIIANLRERFS